MTMENARERIDTDELSNVPIEVWVGCMEQLGNENEINQRMHEWLFDDVHNFDVDISLDDYETVVVSTYSFTGCHYVRDDGYINEMGLYVHDKTDWEIEVECPIDIGRLNDVVPPSGTEHYGESTLTVGERNPNLGNNRI